MRNILILLLITLGLISLSFFGYTLANNNQKADEKIVSPLPSFLSVSDNKQVSTLSLWLPILKSFLGSKNLSPDVSAKSVLIFDTSSEKVLYEKNPKEKLPMASLTKIMTAIISLENAKKDDKYVVTKDDIVGEDSMGLEEGEILSLSDLLYGLMLHSGNDAAETLANNFSGGRTAFIKAMNDKTKALGLFDTNFTNPTGLEGDGKQYTTVYDLSVITKYALDNFLLFNKIASTFDYTIPQTDMHKEFDLENETNLLTSYPGVKGVKTGYTPEAGLCLITYLDYGGHKIIGVILGSDDRRGEMIELLDYSLKTLNITPPHHG